MQTSFPLICKHLNALFSSSSHLLNRYNRAAGPDSEEEGYGWWRLVITGKWEWVNYFNHRLCLTNHAATFQCIPTFLHIFTKEQCFINTHYHLHLSICTHTHTYRNTTICRHTPLSAHTRTHTTSALTRIRTHYQAIRAHTHTHTLPSAHPYPHPPYTTNHTYTHTHTLNAYVAITFYLCSQVNKVPTNMPDSLQNWKWISYSKVYTPC